MENLASYRSPPNHYRNSSLQVNPQQDIVQLPTIDKTPKQIGLNQSGIMDQRNSRNLFNQRNQNYNLTSDYTGHVRQDSMGSHDNKSQDSSQHQVHSSLTGRNFIRKQRQSNILDQFHLGRVSEVPIQDIIDAKLHKLGFGIEGYTIRKYNPFLDKPRVHKIVNTKKTDFIDEYVKIKSLVQIANMNMSGDINDKKKKSSLPKSPRITLPQEIEKKEKKFAIPGPGQYTVKNSQKLKGAFKLTDDNRSSLVGEAEFLSEQIPGPIYDSKYEKVHKRVPSLVIHAPPKKNQEDDSSKKNIIPAVGSYEELDSFKKTQVSKPKFYLNRQKVMRRQEEIAKSKQYIPGVGKYEFEKSFEKSTRGLAKGWK